MKLEKTIKDVEKLAKIQCSHGNWDYDEYMHGMANGMILCLAILKEEEPKYLNAPETWLASDGRLLEEGRKTPLTVPEGSADERN